MNHFVLLMQLFELSQLGDLAGVYQEAQTALPYRILRLRVINPETCGEFKYLRGIRCNLIELRGELSRRTPERSIEENGTEQLMPEGGHRREYSIEVGCEDAEEGEEEDISEHLNIIKEGRG